MFAYVLLAQVFKLRKDELTFWVVFSRERVGYSRQHHRAGATTPPAVVCRLSSRSGISSSASREANLATGFFLPSFYFLVAMSSVYLPSWPCKSPLNYRPMILVTLPQLPLSLYVHSNSQDEVNFKLLFTYTPKYLLENGHVELDRKMNMSR